MATSTPASPCHGNSWGVSLHLDRRQMKGNSIDCIHELHLWYTLGAFSPFSHWISISWLPSASLAQHLYSLTHGYSLTFLALTHFMPSCKNCNTHGQCTNNMPNSFYPMSLLSPTMLPESLPQVELDHARELAPEPAQEQEQDLMDIFGTSGYVHGNPESSSSFVPASQEQECSICLTYQISQEASMTQVTCTHSIVQRVFFCPCFCLGCRFVEKMELHGSREKSSSQ